MSNNKETEEREELLQQESAPGASGPAAEDQTEEQSAEEIGEVDLLKAELQKEKDKFLRLFAEFENYKKRTSRERMDLFRTAGQEVISALLPILDDFDRATRELERSEDEELYKGVALIQHKLRDALRAKGLEDIEVREGDAFDAEIHEAVTQVPAPDKKLRGRVMDVIEKGYKLGDRIIRHPKVVVGK